MEHSNSRQSLNKRVQKRLLPAMALSLSLITGGEMVMAEKAQLQVNDQVESQKAQQLAATESGSPWLASRLLVPHLTVVDVVESKRFYQEAFGFCCLIDSTNKRVC